MKKKLAVLLSISLLACSFGMAGCAAQKETKTSSAETSREPSSSVAEPSESTPTEKDTIRSELNAHYRTRLDEIMSELKAKGQTEEIMFDAEGKVAYEKAVAASDVLKKHNRLDKEFSFENVDAGVENIDTARDMLIECAKAACELLHHPDSITLREEVILEMFLEEGYYSIREYGGQEDLLKEIEKTVNLPF